MAEIAEPVVPTPNRTSSHLASEDLTGMAKECTSDVEADIGNINDPSQLSNPETRRGKRDRLRITAAILVFASLLWWSRPWSWIMPCKRPTLTSETVAVGSGNDVPDIGFPESFLQNWGQYSPYIPAATYIPPPPGCIVNQVRFHMLHLSPGIQLTNPCLRLTWYVIYFLFIQGLFVNSEGSCNDMAHGIQLPTPEKI
jgi:hypothetical protein